MIVENVKKSRGEGEDEDQGRYFEGGKVHQDDVVGLNESVNPQNAARRSFGREQKYVDEQNDIDYEIEKKIMEEKTNLLNQVEQDTMRINNIIGDIGVMVNEQG